MGKRGAAASIGVIEDVGHHLAEPGAISPVASGGGRG